LPYFNDVAIYKGQKIHFLKRAQILSAEIWAAFRGQGIGKFKDLDYLTGFADYKVPQILNYLGVLNYSEKLNKKIENKVLIKKGSKEEVEIRGCMLAAIECLHNELVLRGKEIPVFLIDHILWNKTQEIKLDNNYHLTKTIFY
jgi:hypothetical protein